MALSTAVDLTAVARVVGIKTEFVNLRGGNVVNLPQRIAVFGQGNSALPHTQPTSSKSRARRKPPSVTDSVHLFT